MTIPQQPIVFLEIGFLKALCWEMNKPYAEITIPKQNISFLEELIFRRSTVYINLGSDVIKQIASAEQEKDLDLLFNHKIVFPYLQKLTKASSLLRSCYEDIDLYKSANVKAITAVSIQPHFLLLDESPKTCKDIQDKLGVICISSKLTTKEYNVRVGLDIISANTKYDIKNLLDKVSQSNNIIIEDPYLAKNLGRSSSFIDSLIDGLQNVNFAYLPLKILIVVKDDSGFDNHYNELLTYAHEKSIGSKGRFNICIIKSTQDMHDRNIYSNSFWISCDSGFKEKYKSNTKWNFHPIGLYYSGYHEKLKNISKWLKDQNICHPLLEMA